MNDTDYTDLKLIDELLCYIKLWSDNYTSFAEMEEDSHIFRAAFDRLRNAWRSGEMDRITAALSFYFDEIEPTE